MAITADKSLPFAFRRGIEAGRFPNLFVHGHVCERSFQDAIMDGPRTFANRPGGVGQAEGRLAIQPAVKVPSRQ